ncbi:tetratricopeptide repeat protein [Candidatus Magnetaquicoccus inordinatus]|uniref:tetratricopeptide repeat protein n=1 Tax=Candidatus Magnetaquicoccus inordinatus TaxID=2496818 RepID=UPI00187D3EC1|nr:tetratricopeptide repeat protein [Candidatus Magnetaquicoccus inordinatus]
MKSAEEFVTLSAHWGTLFSADLHAHFRPVPEEISQFLATELPASPAATSAPVVAAASEESAPAAEEDAAQDELKRLRAAAAAGQPKAQHYLAALYSTGTGGVELNWPAAIELYHKAADQGLSISQNNLGFLYATGQGVQADPLQAYMWFQLAFRGGYQEAGPNLDVLAQHLTAAQRQQAEEMAWERLRRAATAQ